MTPCAPYFHAVLLVGGFAAGTVFTFLIGLVVALVERPKPRLPALDSPHLNSRFEEQQRERKN